MHGKEVLDKKNAKAAVCSDCHSAHSVSNSSADPFKLAVTAQCGSCHEANYKSYKATYHGQINTLGYAYTAKCYNCHGSHEILKVERSQIEGRAGKSHEDLPRMPQRQERHRRSPGRLRQLRAARARP